MFISPAPPEAPGPRAARVIQFIETFLRLEDGEPFILQPWQRAFVAALYAPGVRRGVLSVAKKNGKTQLAAALALAHIVGPEKRPGGRVLSAAAGSREQAALVFERARMMVWQSAKLLDRLSITASKWRLEHRLTLSRYEALPAKARTVQGQLPVMWIYDEFAQALDSDLYDALDRGQGTVSGGGLGLVISTRSHRPGNPLADLLDAIERGHKLGLMQHWIAHVYSGDPAAADEFAIENVALANPGLSLASDDDPDAAAGDGFLGRDALEQEVEEARLMPSKRAAFRAYRLNIESEPTESLVDMRLWSERADPACAAAAATGSLRAAAFERIHRLWVELVDEVCVLGLDMSATQDLTSLALWFPRRDYLAVWSWLPEAILAEREADDRVPYRAWAEVGDLRLSPGATIEPTFIAEVIRGICARYQVLELRYDRWRTAAVMRRLAEVGADVEVREFGQGYKDMGPAIEDFERRIINASLIHDDNPVTNYGLGSCLVASDPRAMSDARKPAKRRGARNDPAVAALMAIADMGIDTHERGVGDFVPLGFYDQEV